MGHIGGGPSMTKDDSPVDCEGKNLRKFCEQRKNVRKICEQIFKVSSVPNICQLIKVLIEV